MKKRKTKNPDGNWSIVIKPKRGLFDFNLREIVRYRELIFLFVKRDFTTEYKQTLFGPVWHIVSPVLTTIVYTFVFGQLAKIGTDGIPHTLFYFSGTMLWGYFTSNFNSASHLFTDHAGLFGKVYFPRLIIPIKNILSKLIRQLIQFTLFTGIYIFFIIQGHPLKPSWYMFFYPLILFWLAFAGVGAGIIISSLTTKYRDLFQIVGFALHLAMYATPVAYPLSEIPARFSWLAYANPVCAPIELFRLFFFGASSVNMYMIISSLGITFFCLFFGLLLFNQNEKNFIDVI